MCCGVVPFFNYNFLLFSFFIGSALVAYFEAYSMLGVLLLFFFIIFSLFFIFIISFRNCFLFFYCEWHFSLYYVVASTFLLLFFISTNSLILNVARMEIIFPFVAVDYELIN